MCRLVCILTAVSAALACGALAQEARAGMRVQFVTLHSAGGLQGEAFLPISSRRVEVAPRASGGPCAGGPEIAFEGKHPSAYVRSVRISLRGEAREHVVGTDRCPAATLRATLEDGTIVQGGRGAVRVTSRSEKTLKGSFEWTPKVEGEPFPLKGEFTAKLPSPR